MLALIYSPLEPPQLLKELSLSRPQACGYAHLGLDV
jgi:hypothetical protein